MSQVRGNWEGSGKQAHWFILACLLLLALPCTGFLPNFWSRVLALSWDSYTHQYITEQAIHNVTLEVLRATTKHQEHHAEDEVSSCWLWMITAHICKPASVADEIGKWEQFWSKNVCKKYNCPLWQMSTEQEHLIPSQTRLGRGFWRAVREVVNSNAAMDFLSSTKSDPVYHFDSEHVEGSISMLRQFWTQIVLSVRAKQYQSARYSLGQLFHSLQVHSENGIKIWSFYEFLIC